MNVWHSYHQARGNNLTPPFRFKLFSGAWPIVSFLLFRFTPRWAFGCWRRFLLRCFGARIGDGADIHPTCLITAPWNLTIGTYSCLADNVDCVCNAAVTIGDNVTVSQNSILCTVAYDTETSQLKPVAYPIVIEHNAWIAANAYIGPGVRIGAHGVVGACSVIIADVQPGDVVAGNPMRLIKRPSGGTGTMTAEVGAQSAGPSLYHG